MLYPTFLDALYHKFFLKNLSMNNGFITLHRKILDWEWYDDLNVTRLFIHCLLRANHKDNNWRGIFIKRGSFLTSISTLSKETRLSTSQIRTAIKKLKSTDEIASQSQAQYSVITMLRYDHYQANDKVIDKPVTNQSQTSDKPVTTNNNENNENKKEYIFNFKNEFLSLGVNKEILSDWLAVRKKKKSSNTKTAFKSLLTEIKKSGLSASEAIKMSAENSWSGFKSNWVKNQEVTIHGQKDQARYETTIDRYEKQSRELQEREATARRNRQNPIPIQNNGEIIRS